MKKLITIVFISIFLNSFGNSDTLFIVKDTVTTGINTPSFCTFAQNTTPTRKSTNFKLDSGDSLHLTIVNTDTLPHSFTIDGIIDETIPAQDTVQFQVPPLADGTYRYYSRYYYGKFLGASGAILTGYEQYNRYCWNLLDIDSELSDSLAEGIYDTIPSYYTPNYFFINGNYYPLTSSDPETAITGNLGDTIIISVVNSGAMINSFHFHGFHFEILNAKKHTDYVGWTKDSTPFIREEAMTLMLVAYQTGLYPIHSHNLMAVTTSGLYPGGMITTINIAP